MPPAKPLKVLAAMGRRWTSIPFRDIKQLFDLTDLRRISLGSFSARHFFFSGP
jgi:hypothetical protein